MEYLPTLIAICIGIGLAASCGFRVFVPFLVASICAKAGWVEVADGFEWLETWPAVIAFSLATVLEVCAYYFPWLDNLLDTIATPLAVVAGSLSAAAFITDMNPLLQWSVAIIAGGGSAGVVQAGTVGLRATSTATTGGIANPVVSTGETAASFALSLLAMFLPILAFITASVVVVVLVRFAWRAYKGCCSWWSKKGKEEELLTIKSEPAQTPLES